MKITLISLFFFAVLGGCRVDKMKKTKEAGARFAWGVLFLTVSNVLTKLCGLFLRVPLTNMLGDTGMAYFN